jgi:hypothetical protein
MCEIIRGQIAAVLDGQDVMELGELALDLFEAGIIGHEEQHAAGLSVTYRHAEDGLKIEGAAGEETGDVRHRAGMIADLEFEMGGRHGGKRSENRGVRIENEFS